MALDVEIKLEGIGLIKQELSERYEKFIRYLDNALLQVCEDAITYSVANKGYKDHTSNLKNSISFAFFKNGQLILMHEGKIPKPEDSEDGQAQVSDNLNNYCAKDGVVSAKGYTLVVVAGMNYGKYVERKGYNVIHLTKYFLEDEVKTVLHEALEFANAA